MCDISQFASAGIGTLLSVLNPKPSVGNGHVEHVMSEPQTGSGTISLLLVLQPDIWVDMKRNITLK